MKWHFKYTTRGGALLLIASLVMSQTPPGKVEELLSGHFEAIGEEKLSAIPSVFVKGRLSTPSGGDVYFKLYCKRQEQLRVEWAQGSERWVEILDGKTAWQIRNGAATELSVQDLYKLKRLSKVASPLRGFSAAELLPAEEKVEGKSFFKLIKHKESEKIEYLLDKESHLLAYERMSVKNGSKLKPLEIAYHNYRDFGGIKLATLYILNDGYTKQELVFDEIVLGYPAPATLFQRPE